MLPRLEKQDCTDRVYAQFLKALRDKKFQGDISTKFSDRLVVATDNSIYQIMPQAVVYPKSHNDVKALFQLANQIEFKEITFSPRGAGTGTNGQSLSTGVIIDCSRYMTKILELNKEAGWVRIQPGVVLDQLNNYLKVHDLFFPINISPSSRATLGGMVNTDASGLGSAVYGKTSDHTLALKSVLVDGSEMFSHMLNAFELNVAKQNAHADIYNVIDGIVQDHREDIKAVFPKLGKRCMTGYNLLKAHDHIADQFNLNYILSGSEGTLACVTEIKLNVIPLLKHKSLFAVQYDSFQKAIKDSHQFLSSKPHAIECVDKKILSLAKTDIIYHQVKHLIPEDKEINALILVEFCSRTEADLQAHVKAFKAELDQNKTITGYCLAEKPNDMEVLWQLRKKGVGLLGNLPGNRRPIAFIEDTIVPPENLSDYVGELIHLLSYHGVDYGIYGHCDAGCLHLRPALDPKLPEDEKLIKIISDQVVELVKKYKGIMWGEHGKGFRSCYGPDFFGEELYRCLGKIKKAFDPGNRLNPGKIAVPTNSKDSVVSLNSPMRGRYDRQIPIAVRTEFEQSINCNGNAVCLDTNADNVICPSAKVMHQHLHSPKGRASVMREWLRQLTENHYDVTRDLVSSFYLRQLNWLLKKLGRYDYSHEVYEAMSGCLECKACATQCPLHVDVPSFKAKFLEHYYSRYQRPFRDMILARLETLAPLQARFPRLANLMNRFSILFGLVDSPNLSHTSVKAGLKSRQAEKLSLAVLNKLTTEEKQKTVVLLQDVVTTFFDAELFLVCYDFLIKSGFRVFVAPYFPSGMLLHSKGYLNKFKKLALENIEYLDKISKAGVSLVGIEPSISLCYQHEYQAIQKTAFKVELIQEWLNAVILREGGGTRNKIDPQKQTPKTYKLLAHCTEKNLAVNSTKQWQAVFAAFGLDLEVVPVGCCGMAGNYGHEKEHQQESKDLFKMSWQQHFEGEAKETTLCTGYSCRSQVERMMGFRPKHPVEVLFS